MYADKGLVEWLLFKNAETNKSIAENVGMGVSSVSDLKNGASIDDMKFKNASAMTKYAEKKLYGESDTEKKIQWMLEEYASAGAEMTKHELIRKMTDSYFDLVKGHFINELNGK